MRLTLHPRLSRIVRALPRGGPLAWLEIVLLAGLAVQLARLIWVVATPVGAFGDWRPPQATALSPAARDLLLSRFDPFFRTAGGAGPAAVTGLSLTLYGIRLNEASGQGSAIIATADGVQSSVTIGEPVVPGVVLKAVAIDHVVLDRGGVAETLYLDQSAPAPVANPTQPAALGSTGSTAPAAPYNAPPAAPAAPPSLAIPSIPNAGPRNTPPAPTPTQPSS